MSTGVSPSISELLPTECWDLLKDDPKAVLVDVRSEAEWSFVGTPDLSELGHSVIFAEWACFPGMSANDRFVEDVEQALDGSVPSAVLFLCRSGVRSLGAAEAMRKAFMSRGKAVPCISIAEGFEGDKNEQERRGGLNGWKARGLCWKQS
ncbi:MAG: rhodanese-like domain-containing protein [Pseudomonadota bacterium]